MSEFKTHSLESAPEASRPILETVEKAYGMIPNIYRMMAESPAVVESFWQLNKNFQKTSFDATQQQVVLLTASVVNGCTYCVAAHSAIAEQAGVPSTVVEAIRARKPIDDPKLEALRVFTKAVVEERGHLGDETVKSFLDAGYTHAQVLEVVLGVALKTLSNYSNHLMHPELDEGFRAKKWDPES